LDIRSKKCMFNGKICASLWAATETRSGRKMCRFMPCT